MLFILVLSVDKWEGKKHGRRRMRRRGKSRGRTNKGKERREK